MNLCERLQFIYSTDPRSQAAHSFDDYHVPGLVYLNLKRAPNETIKIYLFEPGAWMPAADRYVVHPHDHAYAFTTQVLAGAVTNHFFHERVGVKNTTRWTFKPRQGFSEPQSARLVNGEKTLYRAGDWYWMPPESVHTISVDPMRPTVLFLTQEQTIADSTSCYLEPDEEPPTLDGLYRPMTPQRYAECIGKVKRLVTP